MIVVRMIWFSLCLIWIVAEVKLARSNRIDHADLSEKEDRSQRILWITILVSLLFALIFKTLALIPIQIDYLPRQIIGLFLFAAGLALRYIAVHKLGRLFTTNVSIHNEHRLIADGPYRWIRHPAYTGLIMAMTGAGLAMGDYIAILILLAPTIGVFNYRIAIEEKLLINKFGQIYLDYSNQTKKLLPWVF
ncbi:MAG: isoprenylcysteine carboxylmethyltransferase family protein [Methylococcaceae bacterium]|nr:isoprenylcysteine carboxylmethyltransferase family protein [Methylococcaceae bacterium]